MSDVTIFHNAECSTSRHALDEVDVYGIDAKVVHYLTDPLDKHQLLDLLAKLEDEPGDLVRKDAFFTLMDLQAADYVTADAVADILVKYPQLMQRPVLVRGDRAIIGRPRSRAEEFLA